MQWQTSNFAQYYVASPYNFVDIHKLTGYFDWDGTESTGQMGENRDPDNIETWTISLFTCSSLISFTRVL